MTQTEHRREDLIRMTPTTAAASVFEMRDNGDGDGDGNTMVGYPILFNTLTEISGWEGNFMERIAPGALTKTLKERGDRIKVLFNHGFDPTIGDKPLGKPTRMEVDDTGLFVEVPFADTSYNQDLKALIRAGAIDGQSFRFSVIRDTEDAEPDKSDENPKGLPERTIEELRLYEFGPVTFPAYDATTVGVRARDAYQIWLRDADREGHLKESTEATPTIVVTLQHETIARKLRSMNLMLKGIPHEPSRNDPVAAR